MNRSKSWVSRVVVVALCVVGCGGTQQEEQEQNTSGEVTQQRLNVGCEVDADGFQTGRCLDILSCGFPASMSCMAGARYPSLPVTQNCGIYVNTMRCND